MHMFYNNEKRKYTCTNDDKIIWKGMSIIANVTVNRKLELVRMIRMQSQSNRNECRERERFLYGYSSGTEQQKELYGAEIDSVKDAYMVKETEKSFKGEGTLFSGFRLRFVLALVIMALFIYLDKTGNEFFGKTMDEISVYLTDNISLEESFRDTLNSFDL